MAEQQKESSKKTFAGWLWPRVLLVIFSLCATLFLLEIAVRFLPPPYDIQEGNRPLFADQANVLSCNNQFGWTGVPNFEGTLEIPGGLRTDLVFNSRGMHDSEHSFEKPAGTVRVLMLGDSYIHAIQVKEAFTSHQVLEDYLNNGPGGKSTNYEVISGGVTGWGTGQELVYYRERGRKFQPDLVLLMLFIGNDFENNLPGHVLTINQTNCYAPYFALCDGQINPNPLPYAPGASNLQNGCAAPDRWLVWGLGKLYQNSRLYQQIEPLIISRRPRQLFGKHYPNTFWALYIPNDEPELERAWQTTQGIIQQMRQEVEADGAQFGVVYFTWSVIIEMSLLPPEQLESIFVENPAFRAVETDRPNKRLDEFLSSQNIAHLDLAPLIQAYQSTLEEPLHFVGDGHWTEEGNRFVAETLLHWISENGLLPE